MGPRRRTRLAITGLALGIGAIAIVVIGLRWLSRMPEKLAREASEEAAERVLAASDSTYRLTFGPIAYQPATRSFTLDWARLETDSLRNARRSRPLPVVTAVLLGGRIELVHMPILGRSHRTLGIGAIRFDSIDVHALLPSNKPQEKGDSAGGAGPAARARVAPAASSSAERSRSATQPGSAGLEWRWGIGLPAPVARIQVGQIDLPRIAIAFGGPGRDGTRGDSSGRDSTGAIELGRRLPHLAIRVDRLVVGPRDSRGTRMRVDNIRLRADRYSGVWDSLTTVAIARVEANAADSMLRMDSVEVRPTVDLAQQRRRVKWRRTRIGASIAAITARGIDYGALLRAGNIVIRRMDLTTPRLDMLVDRLPEPDPRPERARMPNEIMRALPMRLTIDTIGTGDGTIVYGELELGRPRPGLVTFERVRGTVTNLSNDPARMSDTHPMVGTASAHLMGAGRLSATIEIPLLADKLDLRYRGTLGPIPLIDFNRFMALNMAIKVRQGDGIGCSFDARVVDGHATGRLTPLYRDLKIGMTDKGGGVFGTIGRHVGSFVANNFKLRTDNPADDGKGELIVGRIDRRRAPDEELFPFFWSTLRPAIKQVMMK
jgi:hypothetical protein